jgi:glycosyltransferase involved in cell wall biosynthesis
LARKATQLLAADPSARRRPELLAPASAEELAAVRICRAGRVSIVLPLIEPCEETNHTIEDILSQSHPDTELIIVKGSTADWPAPASHRQLNGAGIRLLDQRGDTLQDALESGFAAAQGEFWAWIPAGARWGPDRIATQVASLRAKPACLTARAEPLVSDDALAGEAGPPRIVPSGILARTWLGRALGSAFWSDAEIRDVLLLGAKSLETKPHRDLAASRFVAVWLDAIDQVYEHRDRIKELADVAFTRYPEIAHRLELLGITSLLAAEPHAAIDLASSIAARTPAFQGSRPSGAAGAVPAIHERTDGRRRVMFQAGDFEQGGLENVVHYLATGLDRDRYDVVLLVLGKLGPAARRAQRAGISVRTLAERRREFQYERLLKAEGIDLVHAHYSVFGAAQAARSGIPFVQMVHNAYVWLTHKEVAAYRAADGSTTAYVCVSNQVARYCDGFLGLAVPRMLVIPNGVDTRKLDAARGTSPVDLRRDCGLDERDFVFLNVASVHGTKAQILLVEAMAEVSKAHPRARLVLVGAAVDIDYLARLKVRIRRLGLERRILVAGHREDVARFYGMANVFVLPSFWEGWSLSLSEAVCAGLPVIASDVGGARELLSQTGDILLKPPYESICDLNRSAIGTIVKNEHSKYMNALCDAMKAACAANPPRRNSAHLRDSLSLRRMVDRHERVIDWLLQGGDPAAARAWTRWPLSTRLSGTGARAGDVFAA